MSAETNNETNNETIRRTITVPKQKERVGRAAGSQRNLLPVKLALDIVILLFLALEYQKRAISMQFHEIGGLALGCLFLVHKLLNLRWIRSVTAGIFSGRIRLSLLWIVDALLTLFMAAVIITGLLISKTLPTAIQNGNSIKAWHYFCAASAMICTGVHLGLHWPLIKKKMWNRVPLRGNAKRAVGILLVCAIAVYGGYSFVTGSALRWLSQPFAGQPAMEAHIQTPGTESFSGNGTDAEAWEAAEAMAAETEIGGTGETGTVSAPDAAQPEGARAFGHDGKMQSGSFGSACATVLSYGSVILLFAALTACLRTGINTLKKRFIPKKQAAAY